MLLGAGHWGPGLVQPTPASPGCCQGGWPRGSQAASQGGAGQPLERRPLQSRGQCAWGHQIQGAQGLWGPEGAAAGAAQREKMPGARRRRKGKAGRWWRGRAPQRKGARSKTGSPRYWALNLPRKQREKVTQALWSQDSGRRQWKEGPSTLLKSRSGLTRQPLTAPAKPRSQRGVERVWGQEPEDLSAESRSKRRDFISPSVQEGGAQGPLGTIPGPAIRGLQLEALI